MRELDPIALPLDGTHLVEASAGTGKTWTITALFLRLLLERELDPDRILVVTFTRAATEELRDRVRARVRQAFDAARARQERGADSPDPVLDAVLDRAGPNAAVRLARCLREIDAAPVVTIHGFCLRILQEYAFDTGARLDLTLDPGGDAGAVELGADVWADLLQRLSDDDLRALLDGIDSPDTLGALAAQILNRPKVQVIPEPSLGGLEGLAAWRDARRGLFTAWHADVDGARKRLRSAGWEPWQMDALGRALTEEDAGFSTLPAPVVEAHAAHPSSDPIGLAVAGVLEAEASARQSRRTLAVRVRQELARRVRERQPRDPSKRSFADLLEMLRSALTGEGGPRLAALLRQRWPAALVDEFQDTDPIQFEIFRAIYEPDPAAALYLIGDPKQAIYAFRGADVHAYLQAARVARHRWTLQTNWRSDPSTINAVNHLYARRASAFVLDGISAQQVKPRPAATDQLVEPGGGAIGVELVFVPRPERQAARPFSWNYENGDYPSLIAGEVARLLQSGPALDGRPLRPRDIAILTRSNGQQEPLLRALRSQGIPAAIQGGTSVLASEEAEEVERLLGAVLEPGRALAVRAALATRAFGASDREIQALAQDEAAWEALVARLREVRATWDRYGVLAALRHLMEREGVPLRLVGVIGGERALTNLLHVGDLLQEAEIAGRRSPRATWRWLRRARSGARGEGGDRPGDGALLRLDGDEDAVRLVTVHKSKGLEYPVVLVPFLASLQKEDTDFPMLRHDPDLGAVLDLDVARAAALEGARRESLAEGARNLYVALTRAKHRTIVYFGAFRGFERSALAWLLAAHADPAEVRERVKSANDATLLRAGQRAAEGCSALAVRSLGGAPPQRMHLPRRVITVPDRVAARRLVPRVISSFSGMIAGSEVHVDSVEAADPAVPGGAAPEPRVRQADVPAGAAIGTAIHAVLEELDFVTADASTIAGRVDTTLAEQGVAVGPDDAWRADLIAGLLEVIDSQMAPDGPSLRDIPHADRIDEMAFWLPVAGGVEGLAPAAVAGALAAHAQVPSSYPDAVRALRFAPFRGFLKGFVDLVFRWKGRYYLVDYKSNHLGDHPSSYGSERLRAAMVEHHYLLQYHLYAVALHRYLSARVPGFDWERDVGGVYYLFLRGMHPDRPGAGVYADRPSAACVAALSAALEGA